MERNLFGELAEPYRPPAPNKTPTMQQLYGVFEDKQCKTCEHCYCDRYHDHRYYKCELWDNMFKGRSAASDIRLKNQACGKYEAHNNESSNDID